MRKYILLWPYGWFDSYMYRDLFDTKRVQPFPLKKPYNFCLLNIIRKLHGSHKVNKIIHLPFKDVWYYSLFDQLTDDTCLLFDTGSLSILTLNFLKKIKQRNHNVKMVLLIVDSIHGSSIHMQYAIPQIFGYDWDLVLSYDKNDCAEYGFSYLGQTIYSRLSGIKPSNKKSDIYFVGRNKSGRNNDVLSLLSQFDKENISSNFYLIDDKGHERKKRKGVIFSLKDIPYEDVISNILSTNCILEVVAKGQYTQTARYYEAVCYNKKLLTNNQYIKELPFYNPKYMKCFTSLDDIDFDWIKKKENINYHYNNEFSPIHIIEKIENLLK